MTDVRKHCEFGGLAGPVALRIRTCMKCGQEYVAVLGSFVRQCEHCESIHGAADRLARYMYQQKGGDE